MKLKSLFIINIQILILAVRAQNVGVKVIRLDNKNIFDGKNIFVIRSNNKSEPKNGVRGFMDSKHGWTLMLQENRNLPNHTPQSPAGISNGCQNSVTNYSCEKCCSGELIFEDNFETFDTQNNWQLEVRIPNGEDAEFVSYQDRKENCYVNNGVLHIVPGVLAETPGYNDNSIYFGVLDLSPSCTGTEPKECKLNITQKEALILPPIVTARIRTKSFQFRYGKVEVRAKLPKGDWIYPLITLEPANKIYGSRNYSSGQLRVAFARGNIALIDGENNVVQGGAVLSSHPDYLNVRLPERRTIENLTDEFHVYTLTWTDKYIALALDGQEYGTFSGGFQKLMHTHSMTHAGIWRTGGYMAPFDVEFYLTLGVAVGGNLEFPDSPQKPWSNRDPKAALDFWNARDQWKGTWNGVDAGLHVDYIRVYAV